MYGLKPVPFKRTHCQESAGKFEAADERSGERSKDWLLRKIADALIFLTDEWLE
jgi:hypothetical protein